MLVGQLSGSSGNSPASIEHFPNLTTPEQVILLGNQIHTVTKGTKYMGAAYIRLQAILQSVVELVLLVWNICGDSGYKVGDTFVEGRSTSCYDRLNYWCTKVSLTVI